MKEVLEMRPNRIQRNPYSNNKSGGANTLGAQSIGPNGRRDKGYLEKTSSLNST